MSRHDGLPVIAGSGLAGLLTAWALAPEPCVVLAPGSLGEGTASAWAQGGMAAAVAADDSSGLHATDTLAAGSHLGDPAVVERVTTAAPRVLDLLIELGVPFDRQGDGRLALGLEGGHSRHRIVHVDGDRTGAGIMRTLVGIVRALPSVTVLEQTRATTVVTAPDRSVTGVTVRGPDGVETIRTERLVLATGGAAAIYRDTTNPLGSHGSGIALAARAGATLGDMEFVQFHPTALDVGRDPMPLLTEALRGAGARLIADGERFVDELAPRDVVAAAVWAELRDGRAVGLDVRPVEDLPGRFGGLAGVCRKIGLDPGRDLLPVRPAAHYHMGGVVTDARGRTDVLGLWAAGEVACTGLHGANRLASNSLLEAAVTGRAVAADLFRGDDAPGVLSWDPSRTTRLEGLRSASPAPMGVAAVRHLMSEQVGVVRNAEGLSRAAAALEPHTGHDHALVASLIARAALARDESCGGHLRSDSPVSLAERCPA